MSDYREFLEQKVGVTTLQQKFPHFYHLLIMNEEEWQRQEKRRKKPERFTELSDLFYPAYLHYDSTTKKLSGKLVLSTTSCYKKLNYTITITDRKGVMKKQDIFTYPASGMVTEQYHVYEFCYDLSEKGLTDCFLINFCVVAIGRADGGQMLFETKPISYKIEDIYEQAAEISDPKKNMGDKSETINVFYKRYPNQWDRDVDYVFENAIRSNDTVNVLLPVSGRIKLKDGYEFGCNVEDGNVYTALIDFKKGGVVYANSDGCFISKSGAYVEWNFAADWNGTLHQSVFNPNTTCELTVQIRFCLSSVAANEVSTFFASSLLESDSFLDCKKFRKLRLCLGCVAEGTKVFMADGSERRIETIELGDRVVSSIDGSIGEVWNVWKGREETLVCVELENGRTLRLTKLHHIMTENGMVQAGELNGGNRIMTLDGLVPIRYLYDIPYNGTVYNLDVIQRDGSHGNMICEGMLITDNMNLADQPQMSKRHMMEASEEEQIIFQEMEKLSAYLNA